MTEFAADDKDQLADLIGRCALKDEKALQDLYEATSAKLFAIALAVVGRNAWAEEALQEAYLKIWNAADSYNVSKGRPMTWLINIVRNQSIDLMRGSDARQSDVDEIPEDILDLTPGVDEHADNLGQLERLRLCMAALDPEHANCVLLIYQNGCSPSEVSREKGWPLDKVKYWARTSLSKIRECLAS